MAIKKSELYSSLWASCDELRGSMDASQYKDYILVLLFMRYVTDKNYGQTNALIEVPDGGSFHDLIAIKGDDEIGDKTNKIIRKMADANDLVGVITVADFNDADKLGKGKEMVDRLTKLIAIFEDEKFNFASNSADGDDILGDAYEYLMKHFATESGKSKGQFYTPAEVSRIMAKVIGMNSATTTDTSIYDPTCGSGSLLLKVADEADTEVTIYGQEKDNATVALAKMNMILHGNEIADIRQGDTLSSPEFKSKSDTELKTFDYAVANPPFSTKSWSNGFDPSNDEYERFSGYSLPPDKNGDYAFLLHFIKSLKSKGKGAIILPHGVLFRGSAEANIRTTIIKKGYIKGIVGLPANLFYGTSIPACIIIIDKENAESRKGTFMIDASKGFIKDGNKNRLREQDVHKIVDVFNNRLDTSKYARMVLMDEIEKNEFNLNIPRYIDNQEKEDMQDIAAHLLGDIPKADIDDLEKYWTAYPNLRNTLFSDSSRDGYCMLKVKNDDINDAIFNHEEFTGYSEQITEIVNGWIERHGDVLKTIDSTTKPKQLIQSLSEDFLNSFEASTLINNYDIYEHLMNYWAETMKDDVYMIVEDGYIADKELIPADIIIKNYFSDESDEIIDLESELDNTSREEEEFNEGHSGEDGVLDDLKNDSGNITKAILNKRIKEIRNDKSFVDELRILKAYINIMDKETQMKRAIKSAGKLLDKKVTDKYKELSQSDVCDLVVEQKWMPHIINDINGEMERVSHTLTARIKELTDRYESTLGELEKEVNDNQEKVEDHLKRMGFTW
jgi:type I restriction enzyme M protein